MILQQQELPIQMKGHNHTGQKGQPTTEAFLFFKAVEEAVSDTVC